MDGMEVDLRVLVVRVCLYLPILGGCFYRPGEHRLVRQTQSWHASTLRPVLCLL